MYSVFSAMLVAPIWPIGIASAGSLLVVLTAAFWAVGILLWALRHATRAKPERGLPRVSVILAARNEEALIGSCLESLMGQDYPADAFDVWLVDDHSDDATVEVAGRVAQRHTGKLNVLPAPPCPIGRGPKKSALMHGISLSKGEILLFTDADCVVKPGWIQCMVSHFDSQTGAITGAVLPAQRRGLAYFVELWQRILVGYTTASAIGYGSPASATGCNLGYRRSAISQIGGIPHLEQTAGDDDLTAQAIARAGWKVRFASGTDAVVEDRRGGDARRMMHASVRHQSVIRDYPVFWRAVYAVSVTAELLFVLGILCTIVETRALAIAGTALAARIVIEGVTLWLFCRRLGVRFAAGEFMMAELLLPAYAVGRAALSALGRFTWQGRTHSAASGKPAAA